jgi:hypothetical protein
MVRVLYPERWVPYHHLAPLAFDKWDALAAMRRTVAGHGTGAETATVLQRLKGDMMVLLSEKDEIVPPAMGAELFKASYSGSGDGPGARRKIVIKDALHDDAWLQQQWVAEMGRYIREITTK